MHMITCQDILELQLDGVELIAGEKGLTRPVTWTYMVQTRPFEEHMNQGNFALCVVDYVRFDLEEAQNLASYIRIGSLGKPWKNCMGLEFPALGSLSPMTRSPSRRR